MTNQVGRRLEIAPVAERLSRSLDSGDRGSLASAARWATTRLAASRPVSSLESEQRELLLAIAEALAGSVGCNDRAPRKEHLEACRGLLNLVRQGRGEGGALGAEV